VAVDALQQQGYRVIDFEPPNPAEGLGVGLQLSFSDGGLSLVSPLQSGENINDAIKTVRTMLWSPLVVKQALAASLRLFSRPAGRNDAWASLVESMHTKTPSEERELFERRDEYRARFHKALKTQGVDYILTVPYALPPIPCNTSGVASLVSANYCCLYNVLDYAAGVVPVAFVDRNLDSLPDNFTETETYGTLNDAARGAWSLYDAVAMDGLPLGVQVVAGKLQEEKTLQGMRIVRDALRDSGRPFVQKEF